MNPDLLIVAGACVVVALALAVGGFSYGLYLGERGRRQAAESLLVLGVPEGKPARRVTLTNAPLLEPKMAPQGFDAKTLKRGADEIKAQAEAAGIALSDDQAVAMAGDMLQQAMYGGGEVDDVNLG